jgi:hypothetical protein
MSDISIGSAVGAGFSLIARRPVSVLIWGLLRVGFIVGIIAVYAPVLISIFAEAASQAQSGAAPAPAQMSQSMMSHMFMLQGVGYLVQFVGLFLNAIILCAVARAVVHPERRAFASLRLGAPELFMAILAFAAGFVLIFAILIFAIPFAIAAAFLAMQHQYAIIAVVVAIAALILVLALIYIAARFAFLAPMMVDDGHFHLFDAWALTKGKVGSIILIGVCLALIALLLGMLIDVLFFALAAGALGFAAGGFNNLQAFFQQPPMAIITTLAPSLVLLAILTIPIEGCALAIFIAPWARAYRDVVPGTPPAAVRPPAAAQPFAAAP